MISAQETIAAIATPPGKGGVAIVRVSGPAAHQIAQSICQITCRPRHAHHVPFVDSAGDVIDVGLALYFPGPHSYTGEDVLELQGHGGPVVIDRLLQATLKLGARVAHPGEFTERAFLNDKIDLAQAEAIIDLIDSASEQAARCAIRSLQGEFSDCINALVLKLTHLRIYVEAAIDFPDEEIDFLGDETVQVQLTDILKQFKTVQMQASQGVLLREGMTLVIAGKPNAGKSSLLNCLSGRDSAIVTDIPGTTRDVMREHINLDGLPVHVVDTAGLRNTEDRVEREGVKRAWAEIAKADHVLLIIDSTDEQGVSEMLSEITRQYSCQITLLYNKIDLIQQQPKKLSQQPHDAIYLSASTGRGIDILKQHLKQVMGYRANQEGSFLARRRHLDALERAYELVLQGQQQLQLHHAGELLAEDLRQAQTQLGKITGQLSSDDLLGKIFSSFCIGK